MSIIYITHDIAVVAEVTDRIGVMYAGNLVELGDTTDVFRSPLHPYTEALMSSFPSVSGEKRPLASLSGETAKPVQLAHRLCIPPSVPLRYRHMSLGEPAPRRSR